MRSGERAHKPRQQSGLVAGCWLMLVCALSGVLVALALPSPGYDVEESRDVFRPEWLVLGTFLVWGVHRAARASWLVALPVVVVASAQAIYVLDTAFEHLDAYALSIASGPLWIAVVAAQVLVFTVAALAGAVASVRDRTWERFVRRRLGADDGGVLEQFDLAR